MVWRVACGVALAFGLAQGALAEPLSGKAAKAALFAPDGGAVQVNKQSFLTAGQPEVLATVAAQQPYYAAIAVSPDEGLMSEATIAAANYHDVETASAAALSGCNAARKGKAECVIVALVRPKGWDARPLQLSSEATAAFRESYSGKQAALAISAGSGNWGIATGENAAETALAACAAKVSGPSDCSVVVAD